LINEQESTQIFSIDFPQALQLSHATIMQSAFIIFFLNNSRI